MELLAVEEFRQEIIYPESDGAPMGETDLHRQVIMAIIAALEDRYRDNPLVYVSGNLFIYYEPGNPSAVFAPDAFVVFGIDNKPRRTYKLWEENNKAPDVVFEITSASTSLQDEGSKMVLCRRLGVKEYFLFDPYREYLEPRLQGYRLQAKTYLPILPNAEGELVSQVLGLNLRSEQRQLRLIDKQSGERLLTPLEAQAARRAEANARRAAEAEIARLQAELNALSHK